MRNMRTVTPSVQLEFKHGDVLDAKGWDKQAYGRIMNLS